MAGLPPKPGDPLPPRRVGTSPRAAAMRDDPHPRERDRDREDRRRSPVWNDDWRRPSRDDDRYQDHSSRKPRDWEDRDRGSYRPRLVRGRAQMDSYRPGSPARRRSPPNKRIPSRSRSSPRDTGPRSPPHRSKHSPSHYPRSRSRSPRRRRSSPHSRHPLSHERRRWSDRTPPPRRRSPNHSRAEKSEIDQSPRSNSRAVSEVHGDEADPQAKQGNGSSRSKSTISTPADDHSGVKQEARASNTGENSVTENGQRSSRPLPVHPTPSGPRRPRTPTGPRVRSPGARGGDDGHAHREDKGKGKEILPEDGLDVEKRKHNRSGSTSHNPRKSKQRSRSRSHSRSPSNSRSRSRSHPRFRSRFRSRSRSRSRSRHVYRPQHSSSRTTQSHSPRSRSRSASRSRSHLARSDRVSPRTDRETMPHDQNGRSKTINIDDWLPVSKPRVVPTQDIDSQIKSLQEQRVKLERDHINIMRGVRRAQHELDLAIMEQRSAEERRKAAERVHERTVKGFLAPIV